MSKSQKTVSLVDIVTNLEKDPEVQKMLAKVNKEREQSPARHERKFNLDLMNLSMEINFNCQQIGNVTNEILNSGQDYAEGEIDKMFAYRQKCIFALSKAQNKYDAKVRELDLAIHNEDALKLTSTK